MDCIDWSVKLAFLWLKKMDYYKKSGHSGAAMISLISSIVNLKKINDESWWWLISFISHFSSKYIKHLLVLYYWFRKRGIWTGLWTSWRPFSQYCWHFMTWKSDEEESILTVIINLSFHLVGPVSIKWNSKYTPLVCCRRCAWINSVKCEMD